MKKFFTRLLLFLLLGGTAHAQTLHIHKDGKVTHRISLSDVDSLTLYKEALPEYEGDSTMYFRSNSMTYSFGPAPLDKNTHILRIPVPIRGTVNADKARKIGYEFVQYSGLSGDTVKAMRGEHYEILNDVVSPGTLTGYIEIELYRNRLEGSYIDGYKRYRLGLRLVQNEHFIPSSAEEENMLTLTFHNAVERPEWYDFRGEKVWMFTLCGEWHPLKLIKMVEYFHAFKAINPTLYRKMADSFGENLEHMPYADPAPYGITFRKYILAPMYEFFSNPANRSSITATYPDFPFDFPHPYLQ